ncbi:MAG: hypothetical protein GY772_22265, partial [bacterium]|nr:hypothetical protein [bacterium]
MSNWLRDVDRVRRLSAQQTLENETRALQQYSGGCGQGVMWKRDLPDTATWQDVEACAARTLFAQGRQAQTATIEQLHAAAFSACQVYQAIAGAEAEKALVKHTLDVLHEAAVTVCEIRFFEVLASGGGEAVARQLKRRITAMSARSLPTANVHPGL